MGFQQHNTNHRENPRVSQLFVFQEQFLWFLLRDMWPHTCLFSKILCVCSWRFCHLCTALEESRRKGRMWASCSIQWEDSVQSSLSTSPIRFWEEFLTTRHALLKGARQILPVLKALKSVPYFVFLIVTSHKGYSLGFEAQDYCNIWI